VYSTVQNNASIIPRNNKQVASDHVVSRIEPFVVVFNSYHISNLRTLNPNPSHRQCIEFGHFQGINIPQSSIENKEAPASRIGTTPRIKGSISPSFIGTPPLTRSLDLQPSRNERKNTSSISIPFLLIPPRCRHIEFPILTNTRIVDEVLASLRAFGTGECCFSISSSSRETLNARWSVGVDGIELIGLDWIGLDWTGQFDKSIFGSQHQQNHQLARNHLDNIQTFAQRQEATVKDIANTSRSG
jgi:hypothetical protein